MIKNKISILFMVFILSIQGFCYGFSDELFEFDLPDDYMNMSYEGMYVFADPDNSGKGITIWAMENSDIKKSVWDIEDSDIERIAALISKEDNIKEIDKKAKLGDEKAVKFCVEEEDSYGEMYILASNKYIYIIMIVAPKRTDLYDSDFDKFKESFKLKDRTTNFALLETIAVAGIAFGGFVVKTKKQNKLFLNNNMNYRNF